jgi:hypothetical protein
MMGTVMSTAADELWALTWARRHIDSNAVADRLAHLLRGGPLDFRTRLLVRDALVGLDEVWGRDRFSAWSSANGVAEAVRSIREDADLGPTAFRRLGKRLMTPTTIETVHAFFRDLGSEVRNPARIIVGGAVALILSDKLHRSTEDIDVVDELPAELAASHELLRELAERHGLVLTHFQSHYLPSGWEARTWSLERFGRLDVSVVDPYDVLVGKLFSKRSKDFADLRTLLPQFDLERLTERVASTTAGFRSEPALLQAAERNWYVLTGQPLPPAEPA